MRTEFDDGRIDQLFRLCHGLGAGEVEGKIVGDDRGLRRRQILAGEKLAVERLDLVGSALQFAKFRLEEGEHD